MSIAGLQVEITYKRIKHLILRVQPDGRVKVSAPYGVALDGVCEFVYSRAGWIAEKQRLVRNLGLAPEVLRDGGRVRLWGKWREVALRRGRRASAAFDGETIVLTGPDAEGHTRALENLYRRELTAALEALGRLWEPRVGRSPALVKLRRMTTRWGTCNTRSKAITINTALAERSPEELEGVWVHELVHLVERSHGPKFQALMDALLPDWRRRQAALKRCS